MVGDVVVAVGGAGEGGNGKACPTPRTIEPRVPSLGVGRGVGDDTVVSVLVVVVVLLLLVYILRLILVGLMRDVPAEESVLPRPFLRSANGGAQSG